MHTHSPLDAKIVKERQTAAWKLFNFQFEVMLPSVYAMPQADMEQFGTPTTGDRKLDRLLANDEVVTYRTIPELAVLDKKGAKITLVHPKDSIRAYELVQNHLKEYASMIDQQSMLQDPDDAELERRARALEDIELLEDFSIKLYPAAKRNLPNVLSTNPLFSKLQSLTRIKLKLEPKESAPKLPVDAPSPFTDSLSPTNRTEVRRWRRPTN